MIAETELVVVRSQFDRYKTKQQEEYKVFQTTMVSKSSRLAQANIHIDQLCQATSMANSTLLSCMDLCQGLFACVTPIVTLYCIVRFLHTFSKLRLYTRPSTWINPKMTFKMEELWVAMTKLGWTMNWEELEDDMNFGYLVGSVPIRVLSTYFQIIEFERGLRGYSQEESNYDFDIQCPCSPILPLG